MGEIRVITGGSDSASDKRAIRAVLLTRSDYCAP